MNDDLRPSFLPFEGVHSALAQPDMFERRTCGLTANGCSILSYSLEMVLLPNYGTRYFKLPVAMLGTLVFPTVCFFTGAVGASFNVGKSSAAALVGFWGLSAYHAFRLRRLMVNEKLECDSEMDNAGWFKGPSWLWRRGVIEPLAVLASVLTLYAAGLLNGLLTLYLVACAFALALKCLVYWYDAWLFRRTKLDMQNRLPKMEQLATGTTPKDVMPQTIRHTVVAA
jgi:hypothetical protein